MCIKSINDFLLVRSLDFTAKQLIQVLYCPHLTVSQSLQASEHEQKTTQQIHDGNLTSSCTVLLYFLDHLRNLLQELFHCLSEMLVVLHCEDSGDLSLRVCCLTRVHSRVRLEHSVIN